MSEPLQEWLEAEIRAAEDEARRTGGHGMKQPTLVWEVTTSDGDWRRFRTFAEAERFARQHVAASAAGRFADSATISGPGESAMVRLDGTGRVWTDMMPNMNRYRA